MKRREFITLLGGGVAAGISPKANAQETMPVVGVVTGAASRETSTFPEPFLRDMAQLGWEDGRNFRVLFMWTEGHRERMPALIDKLFAQRAAVVVAFGKPAIDKARSSSSTVPIVGMDNDMIKSGLAASMARPGGNVTGVSILASELDSKRLELLHEIVPSAKRIGVLEDATALSTKSDLDEAARALDLELIYAEVRKPEEVANGLDLLLSSHVEAVNVLASPLLAVMRGVIVERLNQTRLPAIYEAAEIARQGGLCAYGARLELCYWHIANLVSKILRGASPSELPIEQPDKFDLVVNMRTAKALGVTISPLILARANEVIE
jgi:ABC-type uncharacterized transport system substrate-binding protein